MTSVESFFDFLGFDCHSDRCSLLYPLQKHADLVSSSSSLGENWFGFDFERGCD